MKRNRHAELVFMVALAAAEELNVRLWLVARSSSGPVGGQQRRRLVKHAVKSAKHPVQARNFDGDAEARIGDILHHGRLRPAATDPESKCE